MTPSRGTSRARIFGARNLARVVVAGVVLAGTPLVLAGTANAAPDEVWDQLAKCESSGKWNTNTGNGFSGGLQFTASTWRAYGGKGSAHNASREEQIAVAERVLAGQGWGAWPACSKKIGAKGKSTPRPLSGSSGGGSSTQSGRTEVKPSAPAGSLTKAGANYTVAAGDTLSAIAIARNIPGGWQAVYERNRDVLTDPGMLRVGQQLNLG
ncbi:transglycosylase family protein [Pseudonocardia acaciae]|uniref:LysM peptidoglycan-binding domain-containing protein n=1 Tax=Pseudonocardia acaciae TaxID=551276 RepID=UPI00048B2910|nr:transglycosylase family protein [Pseudonocardia acaciae]